MNSFFISFNFNSWKPVAQIDHNTKIKKLAEYVIDKYGEPTVIGIQEFITGGGKYLEALSDAFDGKYYVVTPPSFDYRSHKRSLITVTLLNKSVVESYEIINIGSCLPNRTAYVKTYIGGDPWYIMNCYMVQIANFTGKADWYISARKEQNNKLWSEIMSELTSQKDARMVALGDFQESSDSSHIKALGEMGYKEVTAGFPTAHNNIDHIFLSKKAWDDFNPVGFALDANVIDAISDHSLLVIMPAGSLSSSVVGN